MGNYKKTFFFFSIICFFFTNPLVSEKDKRPKITEEKIMTDDERNAQMIETQLRSRGIEEYILTAIEKTPRVLFVEDYLNTYAYKDSALPTCQGQTISQPYIIALMTQLSEPKKSDTVLEIGTGSGYQAAVISHLVKEVHSVERIAVLALKAKQKLQRLEYENVTVHLCDGSCGLIEHAPYDIILITCSTDVIPKQLFEQLNVGGRLIAPIGDEEYQELRVYHKTETGIFADKEVKIPVKFVPLIKKI